MTIFISLYFVADCFAPFEIETGADASLKRMLRKSHTKNANDPGNESIVSGFSIASSDIWADNIPALTPSTSTSSIVSAIGGLADPVLELVVIQGETLSYTVTVPTGHQLTNHLNPSTGSNYTAGQRVQNIIPQFFGSGYRPKLFRGVDEVGAADSEDWFLDERAGVVVSEEALLLSTSGTLSCFVYVGNFLSDVSLTPASSSTDNALVRFDGGDGRTIQNSAVILNDKDLLNVPGPIQITGDTNETQLQVTFNSSQSTNGVVFEQSDGTDVFSVENDGDINLKNSEQIINSTDDFIEFQGVGGSNNTDLRIDLDGTHPIISSPTDLLIEIAEDLQVSSSSPQVDLVDDGGDDFRIIADANQLQLLNTTDSVSYLFASGTHAMSLGAAGVPTQTFVTDGTGTAEIALPAGSIDSTEILDATILEVDLKVVDTPSDEECLTFESTTGDFEWQSCGSGGSGAFSDSADPIVQNTTTKDVVVGTAQKNTSKLTIDGDDDQVQVTIQGHSTQGSNILIVEKSDNVDIFTIDNSGGVQLGSNGLDGRIIFYDDDTNDHKVTFTMGSNSGVDLNFTWPNNDGEVDQVLTTDGDGKLNWVTGGKTDKISEGDSSVEVIDTGTGKVDTDIDGVLEMRVETGRVIIGSGAASVDYQLEFDGENNNGILLWDEDGDFLKSIDDFVVAPGEKLTVGSTTTLGKVGINGEADEVQLLVQANGTQSNNIFVVEQSDGTDVFTVDNNGGVEIGGDLFIKSNNKLYLEGTGSDTYFTYNGTSVQLFVNGFLTREWSD